MPPKAKAKPKAKAYPPLSDKSSRLKYDRAADRYYIYSGKEVATKNYIDDKRNNREFQPTKKYLNTLTTLLKKFQDGSDRVKKRAEANIFNLINDTTLTSEEVRGLLGTYNFSNLERFDKLYNSATKVVKKRNSRFRFAVEDVSRAQLQNRSRAGNNVYAYEVSVKPENIPQELEDPDQYLKDYGMGAVLKFLSFFTTGGRSENPRDFQYVARMNHRDSKFQVSYVMKDFTNNSVYEFLHRVEQFIQSSSMVKLSQLELSFSALRDMSAVSGGALSEQMKQELSTKRSFILIKNQRNECFWMSMVLLLNYGTTPSRSYQTSDTRNSYKKELLNCVMCVVRTTRKRLNYNR